MATVSLVSPRQGEEQALGWRTEPGRVRRVSPASRPWEEPASAPIVPARRRDQTKSRSPGPMRPWQGGMGGGNSSNILHSLVQHTLRGGGPRSDGQSASRTVGMLTRQLVFRPLADISWASLPGKALQHRFTRLANPPSFAI